MNRSDYFKRAFVQPVDDIQQFESLNEEDITSPIDMDEMDSLCPVNDLTGFRDEPLTRILDPNTPDGVRTSLLSTLQMFTTTEQYKGLSDEQKLALTKLRSCQTPSELKEFASAINQYLDYLEDNEHPNEQPSEQPSEQPNNQPSE